MGAKNTGQKVSKYVQANDLTESVSMLVRIRLPWLVVGLIGGFLASLLVSRFEFFLSQNVQLAFFLPLIVYLSDAIGTQTETIYIRNVGNKSSLFKVYLRKEMLIGPVMGLLFGTLAGAFTLVWLHEPIMALAIGLAMLAAVAVAPVVALLMARLLQIEHQDPAVGAGPFTTIIQNIISITIYFTIATLILSS